MPLIALRIEGYKSLKSISWRPGGLNVLIGPNASGKSNLLRAIGLLQTAVSSSEFPKALLSQGGVSNLVWDGKSERIIWQVVTSPVPISTRDRPHDYIRYKLELSPTPWLSSGYSISRESLSEMFRVEQRFEETKIIERDEHKIEAFQEPENKLVRIDNKLPLDQTMLSLSPFSSMIAWLFRSNLDSWSIYHDVQVHEGARIREAAITRVEKRVSSDGQNLIPVLHTLYTSDREFKKSLDGAMKTAFGDEYEEMVFSPAADQKINLRVRWKSLSTAQSAADLSDGTIRFLLLLTVLANPEKSDLIGIDEPEIGLHPGMFPIIAEFAAEAAKKSTIILSTHSPQFLDAFGENIPTTTVTRWTNGETQLQELSGDKLSLWLKEFSLGTLFKSGELEELE